MRKIRQILTGLLSLCLLVSLCGTRALAAEEPYTYQVTFYTGNHGAFTGSGQVNVDNGKTGSSYKVTASGSSIVVSGLKIGDRVNFDAAMEGAVSLGENSKYYVKGIRLSGRDNDTVGMSSFEVKGDQEYVVAYGIRGNMTSYVVNYQDTEGNTLATSRTYYGNVGDRPVIAFLYLEGYEPQAYNLTKTLSANAAENVFTFTYARVPAGGGGGTGGAAETPGGEAEAPAPEGGAQPPAEGTPAAPAGGGAGAAAAAAPAGGAADAGGAPGGGAPAVEAPDEGVPAAEGPQELQELDDEEVPLAGEAEDGNTGGAKNIAGAVAIAGVAAIALIAMLILWLKRKKKDDEEKNKENE